MPKFPQLGGVEIEYINVGSLSELEKNSLINILTEFRSCFASDTNELGCTELVQMKINTTSNEPVYHRPYRLSHSEQATGITKEAESSYASPVILVKKKNGDSRLCVDYRALNAITVRDRYPLPNIDDQVSKLAGKKRFTSLDMAQGYHQVKICPDDTHKTAFVTPQGHYEYLRVPFGLANAPAVFMRLINKIIGCSDNPEILSFLDDLLLPSSDVQGGLTLLKKVLKNLTPKT